MKTQILRILRNSPDYVSGQELCEELGVSRTAVWKSMNKLKEEGYEIEAVQNRGYHLISCPDVVTGSEVGSRLSTSWAGRKILHYKETDSTNNQQQSTELCSVRIYRVPAKDEGEGAGPLLLGQGYL